MDGSTEQPKMTAGLDLGDKYSLLCLIDTQSGEVIEEGRLRTAPEALRRRFSSEQQPLRIAIEAGTHSPWVSRLLEECGHQVLVANARKVRLIYGDKHKTDKLDAENLARLARVDPRLLCPLKHRGKSSQEHLAIVRSREDPRRYPHAADQSRPRSGQILRGTLAQVLGQELPQEGARSAARGACAGSRGPLLETIEELNARIRDYDRKLEEIAKAHYPETDLLPGGGRWSSECFGLRADPRRSLPLREEPGCRSLRGAGAGHRAVR